MKIVKYKNEKLYELKNSSLIGKVKSSKYYGDAIIEKVFYRFPPDDSRFVSSYKLCQVRFLNTNNIDIFNITSLNKGIFKDSSVNDYRRFSLHLSKHGFDNNFNMDREKYIHPDIAKISSLWLNVINRVIDKNNPKNLHRGCPKISNDWKKFKNFYRFILTYEAGYCYGFDLDKDLLVNCESRLYSSSTAMFVPQYVNKLIVLKSSFYEVEYPIGVFDRKTLKYEKDVYMTFLDKRYYSDDYNEYNGVLKAFADYKVLKEYMIKYITEILKTFDILHPKVYNALLNFKVLDLRKNKLNNLEVEDFIQSYQTFDNYIKERNLQRAINDIHNLYTKDYLLTFKTLQEDIENFKRWKEDGFDWDRPKGGLDLREKLRKHK